jgi:hypothetical protein
VNFDKPAQPPGRALTAPDLDPWDELQTDPEELNTIPPVLGPAGPMSSSPSSDPMQVEAPGIDPDGMSLVSQLNWRVPSTATGRGLGRATSRLR